MKKKKSETKKIDAEALLLDVCKIVESHGIEVRDAPSYLTMAAVMFARFAFEHDSAAMARWQKTSAKVIQERCC